MAAVLRGSCLIFWMFWIVSLAYWLGFYTFNRFFVAVDSNIEEVERIIMIVCLTSACLSFTGCCFTFCDITNFAGILCYGIPLAVVVPAWCIMGIVKLNEIPIIGPEHVKATVQAHWFKHGKPPFYLVETEVVKRCCGLDGPADYRDYLYGANCSKTMIDVPYSCCNLRKLLLNPSEMTVTPKKCEIFNKTIFYYNFQYKSESMMTTDDNNSESMMTTDDINNSEPSTMNQSVRSSESENFPSEEELLKPEIKCKYTKDRYKPTLKKEFQDLVKPNGCMKELIHQTQEMLDTHFAMLFLLIIMSYVMLGVILRNWCNSPTMLEMAAEAKSVSNETLIVEHVKSKPLARKNI